MGFFNFKKKNENYDDDYFNDNYASDDYDVPEGQVPQVHVPQEQDNHYAQLPPQDDYSQEDSDPEINTEYGNYEDSQLNGSSQFTPGEVNQFQNENTPPSTSIGMPSLINLIGPAYWSTDDLMQDRFVMSEAAGKRTYGVAAYVPPSGYPATLDTRVFEDLLDQKCVDLTLDVIPVDRNKSIRDITNFMNVIQSNSDFQTRQGSTFNMRQNITAYNSLDTFLDQVAVDENKAFELSISMIIYGNSEHELEKNCDTVRHILGSKKGLSIYPYAKRQESGYLQTLPIGAQVNYLDDTYRNMDRRSLSVMDIARNAGGRFNGGIPIGIDLDTASQNTQYLNIFGTATHQPDNYNCGIVGISGGGKSVASKLKIAREVSLKGWEHRIIDPDGEYVMLTKKLNGLNLNITPTTKFVINPMAISATETPLEEEEMTDELGHQMSTAEIEQNLKMHHTGVKIKTHDDGSKYVQRTNYSAMYFNVERFLNIILTSTGDEESGVQQEHNPITPSERSRLFDALQHIVQEMGITEDPDSLYQDRAGQVNGHFYTKMPKPEPTLTDLYNKLIELNTIGQDQVDPKIDRLIDAIKPYLRTGTMPMFDGQSFFGEGRSNDLNNYLLVNFNISSLEGSLKDVAYYVIMQYLWEQWMSNPGKAMVKKVLDCDEILQFIHNVRMFNFYEKMVRQDRKRYGSLTWITQDVKRFRDLPQAQTLATESEFLMLFKSKEEYRQLLKDSIGLTDGAINVICQRPKQGEGILYQEGECVRFRTNPYDFEWDFVESNRAKRKEHTENEYLRQLKDTVVG